MALPEPKPGLVIRYDYLWTRESAAGKQQSKDRPAGLVAASDSTVAPRFVVILQITHPAPTGENPDRGLTSRWRTGAGEL
jgi:hypothetical protein